MRSLRADGQVVSSRIALERGDPSYKISASWLKRLESDEHELTVNKLIALAEIYSISQINSYAPLIRQKHSP